MAHNKDVLHEVVLSPQGVPLPPHLREMDILAAKSINGDGGGTYAPASPIVIGGEGLHFDNKGTIAGGIETGSQALPGALSLVDTWPQHGYRTRRVVFPIRDALWSTIENFSNIASSAVGSTAVTQHVGTYFYHSSGALQVERPLNLICPLDYFRFPTGGKIVSITLNFRVGFRPTAVPTIPMSFTLMGRAAAVTTTAVAVTRIDPWAPFNVYKEDDLVLASNYNPALGSALAFRKSNAGSATSGGTEPAGFATAVNGTLVTEGGITWHCISLSSSVNVQNWVKTKKYSIPATPDLYYNSGQPQAISTFANNVFETVTRDFDYVLFIQDAMNTRNIYHSLVVEFETTEYRP